MNVRAAGVGNGGGRPHEQPPRLRTGWRNDMRKHGNADHISAEACVVEGRRREMGAARRVSQPGGLPLRLVLPYRISSSSANMTCCAVTGWQQTAAILFCTGSLFIRRTV
jgi:hypothetical protein